MQGDMDGRYFSRAAAWSRTGERLVVIGVAPEAHNEPRMVTMDPWHEVAFMAADGGHTVGEFVTLMGKRYRGGAPARLREQIHGIIGRLVGDGVVSLHEGRRALPAAFAQAGTVENKSRP